MIKAVLFDYGGVVTHGGKPGMLSNNLAARLEISDEQATTLLGYGFDKIKRGLIDGDEFWRILEEAHGAPIPEASRDIWLHWEDIAPIEEVMGLRQQLQDLGIKTGILSNVEPVVAETLYDHGAYDDFTPLILSCEVGYAKPDPEIYELALSKLGGLKSDEVLFIDDQEKMLAPARQLGMQTLLAESPEQLIRDTKVLLSIAG